MTMVMCHLYRLTLLLCATLHSVRITHGIDDLLRELKSHARSVLSTSLCFNLLTPIVAI